MIKRKSAGIAVLAAGCVLLSLSLILYCANRTEDRLAGERAKHIAAMLEAELPTVGKDEINAEEKVPAERESADDPPIRGEAEMATAFADGDSYVGIITIPSLGLDLPVMSEWSYDRLTTAPCRQFGSPGTGDLVIAAHNYRSHFGSLARIVPGDGVQFTDMSGTVFCYTAEEVRTVKPDEVGTIRDSGYDLVLYTCDYSGKSRVAVFCTRSGGVEER